MGTIKNQSVALSVALKDANETNKTLTAAVVSGRSSSTARLPPETSGCSGRGNSGARQAPAAPGYGNRSRASVTSGRSGLENSGTRQAPVARGSGSRGRSHATPGGLAGHRARVVGDHEHVGREGLVRAGGWITLDAADGQPSLRTQITKPYLQRIED